MYTFEYKLGDTQHTTTYFDIYETKSLKKPCFILKHRVNWKLNSSIWHGDICKYSGKYYMLYCGSNKKYKYIGGMKDNQKYLWVAVSSDGINFKEYSHPVLKMNGVYRSSLVIVDKKLICYFSVMWRYTGDLGYRVGNRVGKFEVPLNELLGKLEKAGK
jgi:hypothetical protein